MTGEDALVSYKVTALYAPEAEVAIRWDDSEIDITWPRLDPYVALKDTEGTSLRAYLDAET